MTKLRSTCILNRLRSQGSLAALTNSLLCREDLLPCRLAVIERHWGKASEAHIKLANIERLVTIHLSFRIGDMRNP